MLALCAVSCIDTDYDLKKLDKEMTLVPGMEVALEDADVIDSDLDVFFNVEGSQSAENDIIFVGGTSSVNAEKEVSNSELASGNNVSIPGSLETYFNRSNGFLSIPYIGQALEEPSIVLYVENPSNSSVAVAGNVTDGTITKQFYGVVPANKNVNLYLSERGEAIHYSGDTDGINVACTGFDEFFQGETLPEKLVVKDLVINGDTSNPGAVYPGPRSASNKFLFNAISMVSLYIKAGGRFEYNTKFDIPSGLDMEKYTVVAGDEIVLKAEVDIDGIKLNFTPKVSFDGSFVSVTMDPETIVGGNGPVEAVLTANFSAEPKDVKKANVDITIVNPSTKPVFITGAEKFKFSVKSIKLSEGITIK